MNPYEVIKRKRNGQRLESDEIEYLVRGFTEGSIPDYQMSAWLMAVWFNGMNSEERATLTEAMVRTGVTLDYPAVSSRLVDKHSTGGVGDGVSLSLVPLVASFGVKVPMMSGRGLGHTGGTLDKLESIPGIQVEFDQDEINRALSEIGALIMGQTGEVAPADREMYSLRDVTATVDSVDLIASSIMSKKIAEGMDALVLDVKAGSGAFMEGREEAVELARAMVEIGTGLDKQTQALITNMDQPLGRAVGNANEMKQAIEILKGKGPADLRELVSQLAGNMLSLAEEEPSPTAGYRVAKQRLDSGDAVDKLRQMIEWQSGDPSVVDDYEQFPQATYEDVVEAKTSGFVSGIDAYEVGMAAGELGAGRDTMEDEIDPAAGVFVEATIGDPVEAGDVLFRLKYNQEAEDAVAKKRLRRAVSIGDEPVEPNPLIYGRMEGDGSYTSLNVTHPART